MTKIPHIQYVLHTQKKMSPTHHWTHFEAEEKSLILSLVLYLLYPSNPIAPLSFSLPLYIDAGI